MKIGFLGLKIALPDREQCLLATTSNIVVLYLFMFCAVSYVSVLN